MLERYATQILKTYLGKYVEDFDPDNISIGLLQGSAELENLKLKKAILDDLDLPALELKHGSIGKISLKIPSFRNFNEPWVIDISRVYMILGTKERSNFDTSSYELHQAKRKLERLEKNEEKWFSTFSNQKSLTGIWNSYSSSITTNIIDNIQVRLFDVHVRFEDNKTFQHPFACGVHISVLSADTTNDKWEKAMTGGNKNENKKKWKLLSLEHLSVYWKTKTGMFGSLDNEELIHAMKSMKFYTTNKTSSSSTTIVSPDDSSTSVDIDDSDDLDDSFLLEPVSAHARCTHDCAKEPLRSHDQPRFSVEFDMPKIPLVLRRMQYHQMLAYGSVIKQWTTTLSNLPKRPKEPVLQKVSLWWKWAIATNLSVIRNKNKPWSREEIMKRVGYINLFKKYLNARYITLTEFDIFQDEVRNLEDELKLDEVLQLRQLVFEAPQFNSKYKLPGGQSGGNPNSASPANTQLSANSAAKPGWGWRNWISWNSADSGNPNSVEESSETTAEETDPAIQENTSNQSFNQLDDKELYELIENEILSADDDDTFMKRDNLLLRLTFNLRSGTISIKDDSLVTSSQPIGLVDLQFKTVKLLCELRPRHETYCVRANLGSMLLRDLNESNKHFHRLIEPSPMTSLNRPSSSPASNIQPGDVINLVEIRPNNKDDGKGRGLFKLSYKKLPPNSAHGISHKLSVEMAPLSLVFIPGLLDRLKHFFSVQDGLVEIDHEVLTKIAQEKYEKWMQQTQDEIKRAINRAMEGKAATKLKREKWAISLDIFAPVIVIPEDWSSPDGSIVVLNLGHITFENFAKDEFSFHMQSPPSKKWTQSPAITEQKCAEDDSDDEDFITPPNTPPPGQLLPPPNPALATNPTSSVAQSLTEKLSQTSICMDNKKKERLSEKMLREKMYEKYSLRFAELQVMVLPSHKYLDNGNIKSSYNVVERFSVELSLERRLLLTNDPRYPSVAVFAHLPHLVLHVSRNKITTIDKCVSQFQQVDTSHLMTDDDDVNASSTTITEEHNNTKQQQQAPTTTTTNYTTTAAADHDVSKSSSAQDLMTAHKSHSKLLMCDFLVNQVSIVLEENIDSRILCVLEIGRIQFKLTKRPFDHMINLSIYSLLLVDVMQQIGHDFELLLASHRNVYMDLGSGNMLDSGLVSPVIPAPSQAGPGNQVQRTDLSSMTSQQTSRSSAVNPAVAIPNNTRVVLDNVAYNLQRISKLTERITKAKMPPALVYDLDKSFDNESDHEDEFDSHSLITVEAKYIKPGSPQLDDDDNSSGSPGGSQKSGSSGKKLNTINAQFNTLDVILNANSWISILDFLHKLSQDVGARHKSQSAQQPRGGVIAKPLSLPADKNNDDDDDDDTNIQVEANFKKLNILLLRHVMIPSSYDVSEQPHVLGRKVATVTMSSTQVVVGSNRDNQLVASGSISGFSLHDLTSVLNNDEVSDDDVNDVVTRRGLEIISIGSVDGDETDDFNKHKRISTSETVTSVCTNKALSFNFDQNASSQVGAMESSLSVEIASACYVHSPRFIAEILSLADEVNASRSKMSNHARQAYKDMARSIMDKVSDYSLQMRGKSTSEAADFETPTSQHEMTSPKDIFYLKIHMQTPILAFPKCPGSFELLVANLGEITVVNHPMSKCGSNMFDDLEINFMDILLKCYRQRGQEKENLKRNLSYGSLHSKVTSGPDIQLLKQSSTKVDFGLGEGRMQRENDDIKILHKTSIKIELKKQSFHPLPREEEQGARSCCSNANDQLCCRQFGKCRGPVENECMSIEMTPFSDFKVTLSKAAYEQVLKTMDNITYAGDINLDVLQAAADTNEHMRSSHYFKSASTPAMGALISGNKQHHSPTSSNSPTPKKTARDVRKNYSEGAVEKQQIPQPQITEATKPRRTTKYTPIQASFNIPNLIFELEGDLSNGNQGIVKANFSNLNGSFVKQNHFSTLIGLSLDSLDIEDMLHCDTDTTKHLVVTSGRRAPPGGRDLLSRRYLSVSTPNLSTQVNRLLRRTSSLPNLNKTQKKSAQVKNHRFRTFDKLDDVIIPGNTTEYSRSRKQREAEEEEKLVKIRVFLVDGNSDAYRKCYNETNRKVLVDFNSLDCLINSQTYVWVLDFFGIGSSPDKSYKLDEETELDFSLDRRLEVKSYYENQPVCNINSEMKFKVKNFNIIFNKTEYQLLKASISNISVQMNIRDSVLRVLGKLGELSVADLSPNGALYRERFVFSGERALDFDFVKYDGCDSQLKRRYDMKLKIRMASIRYLHTHRFQNEVIAFCLHFQQLQEILQRMNAASVGQNILRQSSRGSRIKLDIKADAPIILIPQSAHSKQLMIANLGFITIKNKFKLTGIPDSGIPDPNFSDLSPQDQQLATILDSMEITLVDMDLYSGTFVRFNDPASGKQPPTCEGNLLTFPSYYVACSATPMLKEKTKLSVQLERNLHKDVRHDERIPDTKISGKLSSIFCRLDHTGYWLVRNILANNIGEQIPDFPQPTASLQSPQTNTILTGSVKTGLLINFHLDNISIELLEDKLPHQLPHQQVSLGRLDFVQSRLNLVSNTIGERTTSLSCQSFSAHDVNANDSDAPPSGSVFYTVLGPKEERSDRKIHYENSLQFELHHRIRPSCEEFTVLLNNMRVYLILSWLKKIQNYLLFDPNDAEEKKDVEKKSTKVNKQQPQYHHDEVPTDGPRKEFTLCFTDTEFVIPEKLNKFDTNAIILRATSVLHYIPDNTSITGTGHLPLRCSLERLEMFSCQLDKEKLTELSIIDPVTINVEVRKMKTADLNPSELAEDPGLLKKNLLDITFTEFNMRFSYNDLILIRAFANSVQEQLTNETENLHGSSEPSTMTSQQQQDMEQNYFLSESALSRLTDLGYERKDAIYAMTLNTGNISHATAWLINHAKVRRNDDLTKDEPDGDLEEVGEKRHPPLNLIRLNVQIDVIKVCLIDDCGNDCDAPLTEISCQKFQLRQGFASATSQSMQSWIFNQQGSATFRLKCDYYNRMLSLWEPFLEPWRCNISWKHVIPTSIYRTAASPTNPGDWSLKVEGSDKFDLNVTTPLMDTAFMTYDRWMTHYKKAKQQQNRQPFVPYVIRNLTGTIISFATQTAVSIHDYDATTMSSTRLYANKSRDHSVWSDLQPGDEKNFNYNQNHEKQRHKRAAVLKLHQIVVKVKGWKIAEPVTVSKVGTYFRHTTRDLGKNYNSQNLMRMVFSISLEDSGKKIITVRSALAIKSRVKIPLELRLEGAPNVGSQTLPVLLPDETIYVPLHLTSSALRLRPKNSHVFGSYQFCSSSIEWQNLQPNETRHSQLIECLSTSSSNNQPFHFAVSVQRGNYPSYKEVIDTIRRHEPSKPNNSNWLFSNDEEEDTAYPSLPGHTIIIMPPVTISNLLPCDLHYYIKNTQVEGTLKPGMDATPHIVHILPTDKRSASSLHIGCLLENFQSCREIVIPFVVKDFQMRMIMKDLRDQTLILNVRVLWKLKCSVRISIMAGYWIVNKTGLPLIVKQDGADRPAAGQYDVHEQARSLEPLLFSYSNREGSYLCTMRLGKKARIEEMKSSHDQPAITSSTSSSSSASSLVGRLQQKARSRGQHVPSGRPGMPSYCESFSTDGGTSTRNLKLITSDNTPNREFCIGISVRRGWGRYLHTHIVTVAPRFLLINKTNKHKLSFAQRHSISYVSDERGSNYHLTIIPGSSVVFHWPRVDLDTLLCVKLADETNCHWSGGFVIDRINAFHIALRLATGSFMTTVHPLAPHCVFLSVEVTLQKATYCITINDADPTLVPPPLRIDNMSAATITYKQVDTDDLFNTDVVAESQLAFACDEPCRPEQIQCSVKGGSLTVTMDMKNVGLEKQLCYENFIYIAIGPPQENRTMKNSIHSTPMRLVLDTSGSQHGNLHLQPLRAGKRSQLWRMTSDGRIFHEGSSPPESSRDLRRHGSNQGLVLDIAEMAFNQKRPLMEGIPLALKPVDERRRSTQTWQFLQCGILSCRHKGLTVQVQCLEVGARPVLAHYKEGGVMLPTQMCSSHKLIPGSGMLSLKIIRDGPTRVLKILDIRQKRAESQDALMRNSLKMKSNSRESGKSSPSSSSKKKMLKLQSSSITNENMKKRTNANDFHLSCSIALPKGFGISLVSNLPEELIYICLCGVNLNITLTPDEQQFSLKIQKLQIDNQLMDAYPMVLLHPTNIHNTSTTKSSRSSLARQQQKVRSTSIDLPAYLHGSMGMEESENINQIQPFISIHAVRQPSSTSLYEIYKYLVIKLDDMNMQIEERLLLKVLQFIGLARAASEKDHELFDEVKTDLYRAADASDSDLSRMKRFYFDHLSFSMAPLKLGVMTSSNLTDELKTIRSNFNFTLIQFQDAPVTIQPYTKRHMFETVSFIGKDFSKHLMDQLIGQAAKILGSVDFLGNPIGLLSDVKAGVTNLAKGNLPDMVLNLTHGLSNSTAKVASSLSNGLGGIVMDEDYGNKRRAIQANARNPGGHVVAGLQGLMAGMIGGLTSVITQPVKGAQMDGATGFLKGIGKGLIGTVAKPVTGVLDFASSSASAVRDISTGSSNPVIQRSRPIRCCHSFQGCLQSYSSVHAEGQQFLYALNRNNYNEYFYEMTEIKIRNEGNLQVLITNKCVYIVKDGEPDPDHIFLQVNYPDLLGIKVVQENNEHGGTLHLIELSIKTVDGNPGNNIRNNIRRIADSKLGAHGKSLLLTGARRLKSLKKKANNEPSSSDTMDYHNQAAGFGHIGYSPDGAAYNYSVKKPRVICQSQMLADTIRQQIEYAKMLSTEQLETLTIEISEQDDDINFKLQV